MTTTIIEWDGHTWPTDGVFADTWKCRNCGRLYGGATTGKPPFRCLCQPGQVWTANLITGGAVTREQVIEIDENGKVHGDDLEHAIASALNRYSAENPSNTPDWILAQFLLGCLAAWNQGVQQRETWYGRSQA